MQRIGCGIWLVLFFALPFFGVLESITHHRGRLLGFGCGVLAWFALVSGYMLVLWLIDWPRRKQIPPENDVPKWVVPLAGIVFLAASAGCVMLWRKF